MFGFFLSYLCDIYCSQYGLGSFVPEHRLLFCQCSDAGAHVLSTREKALSPITEKSLQSSYYCSSGRNLIIADPLEEHSNRRSQIHSVLMTYALANWISTIVWHPTKVYVIGLKLVKWNEATGFASHPALV